MLSFLSIHSSFQLFVPILHTFYFILELIVFAHFVVLVHIVVILVYIIVG
jgi:hypothetical protein